MIMNLQVARGGPSPAVASGGGFFYEQWGPITTEISGDVWSVQSEPEDSGLYRVSLNVRKISGDTENVEVYAGTSVHVFASSGTHVSGVVDYDPELTPWIALQANMNLQNSSALIEVSGFICTWT